MSLRLQVGEIWFVRLPGSSTGHIETATIKSLTEKTVLLQFSCTVSARYLIIEVNWIEKHRSNREEEK